jgi:hypothetical protein
MRMTAIAGKSLAQFELDDGSPSTDEGDMLKTLVFLATWRPCNSCGERVLYIDDNARTDTQFVCGRCLEGAERELRSLMGMVWGGGIGPDDTN